MRAGSETHEEPARQKRVTELARSGLVSRRRSGSILFWSGELPPHPNL